MSLVSTAPLAHNPENDAAYISYSILSQCIHGPHVKCMKEDLPLKAAWEWLLTHHLQSPQAASLKKWWRRSLHVYSYRRLPSTRPPTMSNVFNATVVISWHTCQNDLHKLQHYCSCNIQATALSTHSTQNSPWHTVMSHFLFNLTVV